VQVGTVGRHGGHQALELARTARLQPLEVRLGQAAQPLFADMLEPCLGSHDIVFDLLDEG
jgi:hypothetical protein